jgi:hypothetical protein
VDGWFLENPEACSVFIKTFHKKKKLGLKKGKEYSKIKGRTKLKYGFP